jgi:hypothetical protein
MIDTPAKQAPHCLVPRVAGSAAASQARAAENFAQPATRPPTVPTPSGHDPSRMSTVCASRSRARNFQRPAEDGSRMALRGRRCSSPGPAAVPSLAAGV